MQIAALFSRPLSLAQQHRRERLPVSEPRGFPSHLPRVSAGSPSHQPCAHAPVAGRRAQRCCPAPQPWKACSSSGRKPCCFSNLRATQLSDARWRSESEDRCLRRGVHPPQAQLREGRGAAHTHKTSGSIRPKEHVLEQGAVHPTPAAPPAVTGLRQDVLHLKPGQHTHTPQRVTATLVYPSHPTTLLPP